MEKYKILNVISIILILLSIFASYIVSTEGTPVSCNTYEISNTYEIRSYNLPEALMWFLFFTSPIALIISLILSIISVIIIKNWVGFLLITFVILAFVPICWLHIALIMFGIAGYTG